MLTVRSKSVNEAARATSFGLVLGTLGRQGSPAVLKNIQVNFNKLYSFGQQIYYFYYIQDRINKSGRDEVVVLLSEIFPQKLALFGPSIEAWVQVACPRLSIDWGAAFEKPLLTPFELNMALNEDHTLTKNGHYPMDYYAHNSRGNWTPKHTHGECECGEQGTDSCCK
jgi:2-(3-amino-3-carboxypropyl)histidine synthase